jgi:DNA polymerase-3 subunit epsilon
MRLLAIDLETTGLDFEKDHIIEIAYVLKDTSFERPLQMETLLIWESYYPPLSKEITKITGITQAMLEQFGMSLERALSIVSGALRKEVEFIVAHNGEGFDKPFLLKKLKDRDLMRFKLFYDLPWIDTAADVEYPCDTRRLGYLAAEHGFLNPFPHHALFDVVTMLKVLEKYDLEKVIERSKSPWATLRALVDYDNRDLAKRRRFNWQVCGDKMYPSCWVKRVKECDIEKEVGEAKFEIVRIE